MKATYKLLVCLLCSVSFTSYSQLLPTGYDTLERSHEILVDGFADFIGSSVENDLTSKFIRGGMITDEIKQSSNDKHKAINRIGAVIGGDLEYRNFKKKIFKKKNWGFLVKGGYNMFAGMLYSKDLYGLAMYGNEPYMGQTLDMSGLDLSYMTFQKVGFGLIDAKSKSNITLNVYNISDRFSADIRTLELTQDEAGDELTVVMDGEVELKNNLKFNQGIGVGFDIDFTVPISWLNNRRAFLKFEAKNLGVAYMYEKQKVYQFDTTINFTGFTFDQIIGENSLFEDSLEVLDTLGIRSTERNSTSMLPGFLQIGKIVDEHYEGKLQSFFGIRLYPTLIYSPYIFAGLDYRPADWIRLGLSGSYGGFGKFRAGLYTNLMFGNYAVGIGSENVIGFVSKKWSGQSLLIKLRCAI